MRNESEVETRPDGNCAARVLTATRLEAWAARRVLRGVPVTRTGVALRRRASGIDDQASDPNLAPIALLCGLAGGLSSKLAPGDVVVPELVGLPDGTQMRCHAGWVEALVNAARELGFEPATGPLLTAPSLVTGDARATWARRGYVAADMEAGLLAARGWEVATIRVILDAPTRSIAQDWERPMRALIRPGMWGEMLWLAGAAPRYCLRAAQVLGRALARTSAVG